LKKLIFFLTFFLYPTFSVDAQEQTDIADGALLRGLDKVSGEVIDFGIKSGDTYLTLET